MTIRLALLAAALLGPGACGRQGDLERPAPLFGERARAEYEAQRTRGADAPDETSRDEAEDEDRDAPVPDPTEPLRLPEGPRPQPNG